MAIGRACKCTKEEGKQKRCWIPGDGIWNSLRSYSDYADVIDQNPYLMHALEISLLKGSSVYDSMFIAAALETGYDLVSSDDKQLKVAKMSWA